MNLHATGRVIAERRRARGLTLNALATAAGVGRSTLAALENGKLEELGFAKVARLCAALDLVLEARPHALETPLMGHRHLTESAGRELTKAVIEDILIRGGVSAWRGLTNAIRSDKTGRLARRVRAVAAAVGKSDPKARAFATLMPDLLREHNTAGVGHG